GGSWRLRSHAGTHQRSLPSRLHGHGGTNPAAAKLLRLDQIDRVAEGGLELYGVRQFMDQGGTDACAQWRDNGHRHRSRARIAAGCARNNSPARFFSTRADFIAGETNFAADGRRCPRANKYLAERTDWPLSPRAIHDFPRTARDNGAGRQTEGTLP